MKPNEIIDFLSTQSNIFELLREDEFKLAKEIWGEKVFTYYYDCTRVWEAWEVGTMDKYDFKPIELAEYEYHLQQMILLKDEELIPYLRGFEEK